MLADFSNAEAMDCGSAITNIGGRNEKTISSSIDIHGGRKALCLSFFFSILLALGNPPVDYFSLDIEGAELPVLNTIPWNKVDIKVMSIECGQADRCNRIDSFMKSVGYKLVRRIPDRPNPQDILYVKK